MLRRPTSSSGAQHNVHMYQIYISALSSVYLNPVLCHCNGVYIYMHGRVAAQVPHGDAIVSLQLYTYAYCACRRSVLASEHIRHGSGAVVDRTVMDVRAAEFDASTLRQPT